MSQGPEPGEAHLPPIGKLAKDYSDKISDLTPPPPGPGLPPGTAEDKKKPENVLSGKFAPFEQQINVGIKREEAVFQKIRSRINSELARTPGPAPAGIPPAPVPPQPPPKNVSSPDNCIKEELCCPAGRDSLAPPAEGVAIHLLSPFRPPAAAGPLPAPVRPGKRRAVVLAAVLLAAGAGMWRYTRSAEPAHKTFPLPYARTAGLAVKGRSIFSADPQRLLLFTLSREDGSVKAVQKIPNRNLSGLAAGSDCLWSTGLNRIYQHNLDLDYSIRWTFTSANQAPSAIYWDGGFLWVGDQHGASISKYLTKESLSLVKEYAAPGVPGGLYVSENLLWILDPAANRINRYLIGPVLKQTDSLDLKALTAAGSNTTGFAVDAAELFLVTENPAELHSIDMQRLKHPFFIKEKR